MPDMVIRNQPWSASVAFAAGDSVKEVKAAPGANLQLVVTRWHVYITTAAAQAFSLQDNNGTPISVASFPASLAVGSYLGPVMEVGIVLTANKNLQYKPAAAGPAGLIIAEGYLINPGG